MLLVGPGGDEWIGAAGRQGVVARRVLEDPFWAALGVTADRALLLRPDGVIGWRAKGPAADPDLSLAEALGRLRAR